MIAGRVQSVALRLLAERETEREAFKPDAWWTVDVTLTNALGQPFQVCVLSRHSLGSSFICICCSQAVELILHRCAPCLCVCQYSKHEVQSKNRPNKRPVQQFATGCIG